MEWLSRMKLDLEAVVEDASDEVQSWKFKISYKLEVCLDCTLSYHIRIPLWGGLFKENPIVLNSCLGASSEAFFTIFNSGYTL